MTQIGEIREDTQRIGTDNLFGSCLPPSPQIMPKVNPERAANCFLWGGNETRSSKMDFGDGDDRSGLWFELLARIELGGVMDEIGGG